MQNGGSQQRPNTCDVQLQQIGTKQSEPACLEFELHLAREEGSLVHCWNCKPCRGTKADYDRIRGHNIHPSGEEGACGKKIVSGHAVIHYADAHSILSHRQWHMFLKDSSCGRMEKNQWQCASQPT